jgi:hypothetical protein
MSNPANMALDGGDPRLDEKNTIDYAINNDHDPAQPAGDFSIEAAHVHNNPDILFEEYLHYAEITRAEERAYEGTKIERKEPFSLGGLIKSRFSKGHEHDVNATVEGGQIVTTHTDW